MNTLKMKITGYDADNHSILVAFASDETQSQDPADYKSYAFQPIAMWPDVTDLTEIKRRIAQSGLYIVEQEAKREQLSNNSALVNQIRDLVGEVVEYPVQELIAQEPQSPFQVI